MPVFKNTLLKDVPIIPELFTPQLTNLPQIKHLKTKRVIGLSLTRLSKVREIILIIIMSRLWLVKLKK